jgi:hypothetical protein
MTISCVVEFGRPPVESYRRIPGYYKPGPKSAPAISRAPRLAPDTKSVAPAFNLVKNCPTSAINRTVKSLRLLTNCCSIGETPDMFDSQGMAGYLLFLGALAAGFIALAAAFVMRTGAATSAPGQHIKR